MGLGEPDLPTPDFIRQAAVRVIQEERNGYTLQAGLPALRELVASSYLQLILAPEDVIITAGSQEALYLALMTLVQAGDEVLIPIRALSLIPRLPAWLEVHRLITVCPQRTISLWISKTSVGQLTRNQSCYLHESFEPDRACVFTR